VYEITPSLTGPILFDFIGAADVIDLLQSVEVYLSQQNVSETVSGSSAIEQRPGFIKLLNKLEQADVLIVTKLDRLLRLRPEHVALRGACVRK
jgi:DNA invertase Pin-like site-specific DNA recombinase